MRLFEAILLVCVLLAFVRLIIPHLREMRWISYITPITLIIAIIQVLVEGSRWQMIPAYTLTAVVSII